MLVSHVAKRAELLWEWLGMAYTFFYSARSFFLSSLPSLSLCHIDIIQLWASVLMYVTGQTALHNPK